MFGYFYPETSGRYLPFKDFETVKEANEYMAQKNGYKQIPSQKEGDLSAWLNSWTGDLYVLRQLTQDAADEWVCTANHHELAVTGFDVCPECGVVTTRR